MTTKTEERYVQVWACTKCDRQYKSVVKASKVTCSNRHNRTNMKLVEGVAGVRGTPRPVPVLRTLVTRQEDWDEPVKVRAKAALVSDPTLLLEALGIPTGEGTAQNG